MANENNKEGQKFFLKSKRFWTFMVGVFIVPLLRNYGIVLNNTQSQYIVQIILFSVLFIDSVFGDRMKLSLFR